MLYVLAFSIKSQKSEQMDCWLFCTLRKYKVFMVVSISKTKVSPLG